jgi:hypothetical protein
MANYRIVPRRGTYKVEAAEPNGHHRVLAAWRTEEAAVSHLKHLQAKEQRASDKPAPGELGWPPPQPVPSRRQLRLGSDPR